ncbi:MAG: AtpZ/AtpI family protein [Pseudomonadota bacterium]
MPSTGATISERDVGDETPEDRLSDLERRIAAMKEKDAPPPHQETHYSQAHLAWRMVIELVAGLGIGFGIGFGLDYAFSTQPIFMVVFTLLGLAAGIKTMMRSAQEVQKAATTETNGSVIGSEEKGKQRDGE